MPQDGLGQFTVARRACAFLSSVFMDREPWGVDSEFHKLAGPDVPLDDVWWNVEVLRVLGVHGNTVHQLVLIGELLVVELLLQVDHSMPIADSCWGLAGLSLPVGKPPPMPSFQSIQYLMRSSLFIHAFKTTHASSRRACFIGTNRSPAGLASSR